MTTGCWYCGGVDGHAMWCQHDMRAPPTPRTFQGVGRLFMTPPDKDPLTTVIDRQLEIERKARAWDSLRHILEQAPAQITPADVLRRMDTLAGPPARDQGLGKG